MKINITNSILNTLLVVLGIINIVFLAYTFSDFAIIDTNSRIFFVVAIIIAILVIIFLHIIVISKIENKKKSILYRIFLILIDIVLVTASGFVIYVNNKVEDILDTKVTYNSVIIVLNDSIYQSINDLKDKKIGLLNDKDDYENYILPKKVLEKISYEPVYYESQILSITDLLDGNIAAIGISANFVELYQEYFEGIDLKDELRVISTKDETVKVETVKSSPLKTNEPFTILFIGADTAGATYRADSLILTTVNPVTKKIVMVDVVRDTYVLNKCNNKMDKITHIGNYQSNQCKLNTVSGLFNDIKISYYVKTNFNGLVELVNLIGGITIDVPYDYTVDSRTVKAGTQKLNGKEVLALARARKVAGASVFTRGKMQMLIIEELLKQADADFIVNNFFKLFDTVGNNFKTNLTKKDLYSFAQSFAGNQKNYEFNSYTLQGLDSSFYHDGMRMTLYTFKPNQNSINDLYSKLVSNLK